MCPTWHWMLLSLEPPPTQHTPRHSSSCFGISHSRSTCLFFHSTLPESSGERSLTKVHRRGRGGICFASNSCLVTSHNFLCPWWSQWKHTIVDNRSKLLLPLYFFPKEKGKWCLSHFTTSYAKPAKFEIVFPRTPIPHQSDSQFFLMWSLIKSKYILLLSCSNCIFGLQSCMLFTKYCIASL